MQPKREPREKDTRAAGSCRLCFLNVIIFGPSSIDCREDDFRMGVFSAVFVQTRVLLGFTKGSQINPVMYLPVTG
jgi:hypothetical protein